MNGPRFPVTVRSSTRTKRTGSSGSNTSNFAGSNAPPVCGSTYTCEPLEWLRDRDPRFMVLPGATVIVEKATGRIEPAVFFPGNELDLRLRTAVKHKDGRYAVLDADE